MFQYFVFRMKHNPGVPLREMPCPLSPRRYAITKFVHKRGPLMNRETRRQFLTETAPKLAGLAALGNAAACP